MRIAFAILAAAAALAVTPATAQYRAPEHKAEWPGMVSGSDGIEGLDPGPELQRGRSARAMLADARKLNVALAALQPQRKALVDAYVVSVALDSDPVFVREAREAGKVLSRRFDAAGRTIVLAGSTGTMPSELPNGSLTSLTLALARVAEVMDREQDVLVLYTTSHGAKVGIAYHDGDEGYGVLSPRRLQALLDELGIRNRVLILSACYSGIFVGPLSSPDTALFTAASSDRPSFGCQADNDWTFFGDAMINHALRKNQPLEKASDEARMMIGEWEGAARVPPSNPQVAIGDHVATWLAPLEARMPQTDTPPVGRPATDALKAGG
ncbi:MULTISPECIES: C13 family peptidase [unclassified Sphingomonas]|uniref:C13 family peptidase n=1 Tax=Sphingomonas TaxID=13687 RepID=UPI00096683A5|nr:MULTISPECIES: C13 family peptidase [unclassified Sphingomonas]MBN8810573.1 peptidase C13 [Sphingomonas sp.]OJY51085.1 MAG: peptidase C13 [Sphingomonas sp. 67-41]